MGRVSEHPLALLILAAFSRHADLLAAARDLTERHWGPVALVSPQFAFTETDYYEPTMGPGLLKQFFAYERLIDPARLAELKLATNRWEEELAQAAPHGEPRPLNLDPGYMTLGKLVLASTKDHAHRIYLQRGIFAEVTLYYQDRAWRHREWTFPDYRRADYHQFFDRCREYLRSRRE
jgi:hypothetical protein